MSRERVIFVCHDVGGAGGMEHHAQRLIELLVAGGREVTVVARTCRMAPMRGLRFRRIPTPSRPFTIAYPAFFAVATALLARRDGAVLHTTGAIVGNHVDVSTVHYCHHAAAAHLNGGRSSRNTRLYRLNARLAAWAARLAEAWCYRPDRTRVLCAVSDGVAAELRTAFPRMASVVRTVPNGVDSDVFRPDPEARIAVRRELGLGDDVKLALFAGGDWERKGLRFAVGALTRAADWHLAVAGSGATGPLLGQARSEGTLARLHLLGHVAAMPRLYAAADAFVLPTSYEAFPLVVLEAAASGLPLLVTRVNGAEQLVDDGRTGWFIERDAGDIARRLTALAASQHLAREMGARARESVATLSWGAMVNSYLHSYEQVRNGA